MGIQIPVEADAADLAASENWPRILLVGPPNVGKNTVLRRLLAMGKLKGSSFSTSGLACHGWTIDTKYYSVDVCISTARLTDDESYEHMKSYVQSNLCQALVFIFDLSNFLTFEQIKECVLRMDLKHVEILLCVGNKADRLPDHFGHAEYRRKLQKHGESSSDPHPEFWDFGIQRCDGSSLLEDAEKSPSDEFRSQCIEWCAENGIEYLEACAADHLFDQCISIDGDSQGVSRIWGALSAHMWPGLLLKDERHPGTPPSPNGEEESSEEGSVVIEYERLSNGSIELWDDDNGPWSFYESTQSETEEQTASHGLPNDRSIQPSSYQTHNGSSELSNNVTSTLSYTSRDPDASRIENELSENAVPQRQDDSISSTPIVNGHNDDDDAIVQRSSQDQEHENGRRNQGHGENGRRSQEGAFNDFEQLMQEMARVRENAHRLPDSERREMAATLALRMAQMLDDDDDE